MCQEYSVVLAGGDTVRSPGGFWVSLTLVGEVLPKRFFSRDGAKAGHALMVTGTLGDSAMGLRLLTRKTKKNNCSARDHRFLTARHLDPTPRTQFSEALAGSNIRVSSMIDISDGLTQDLGHLCRLSGKGADIEADHLPLSNQLKNYCKNNNLNHTTQSLTGGEDYELLFTIPPEDVKKTDNLASKVGVPVTEIGKITRQKNTIRLLRKNESPETIESSSGFDHFR